MTASALLVIASVGLLIGLSQDDSPTVPVVAATTVLVFASSALAGAHAVAFALRRRGWFEAALPTLPSAAGDPAAGYWLGAQQSVPAAVPTEQLPVSRRGGCGCGS
jgi:hypothetical protein